MGLCSRNGKGLPILPFLGVTALVVWGAYLFSTVGDSLTPLAIALTYISPYIKGIIIGLILGDGSLQLLKGRKNASFRLGQCSANSGFLWHVFSLLQHYCQSYPAPYFGIRKGRTNFGLFIRTRSYPIFTELYHLFHKNGRKTIPWCIAELLTPQGLAMWAMSDGCKAKGGFYLSTNSFHYEEVQLLCNALKERFNLDCTIHLQSGQPRLYICCSSMNRFRSIVAPYFHSSMMYKLY